ERETTDKPLSCTTAGTAYIKHISSLVVVAGLWGILTDKGRTADESVSPLVPRPSSLVTIDLSTALRLAGVQNPAILLARQRVVEAVVQRQLAAAVFLPSLNAGLNYDAHTGPLQQSSGNI